MIKNRDESIKKCNLNVNKSKEELTHLGTQQQRFITDYGSFPRLPSPLVVDISAPINAIWKNLPEFQYNEAASECSDCEFRANKF